MNSAYAAIVLAAGLSSRMGVHKPLLPIGHTTAIRRVVDTLTAAGVKPIVVTGHHAADIDAALDGSGAVIVYNSAYESGMFSSVLTGARAIANSGFCAFFMLPADCCTLRIQTLEQIMAAFERCGKIVYPTHGGRRGHPPIVPISLLEGLLAHDGTDGARGYFSRFESVNTDTDDGGVLLDMDTPSAYADTLRHLGLPTFPSPTQCAALFEKYATHERIIRHGEEVAELCVRAAKALQGCDVAVCEPLLCSAATVHDISRAEDNHARVGAELLLQEGYPDAAELVRTHMEPPGENATVEAELLYVADKLMRRGQFVVPSETLAALQTKFAGDPDALAAATRRMEACSRIIEKYERKYGLNFALI